jgi:hypothetical protein
MPIVGFYNNYTDFQSLYIHYQAHFMLGFRANQFFIFEPLWMNIDSVIYDTVTPGINKEYF